MSAHHGAARLLIAAAAASALFVACSGSPASSVVPSAGSSALSAPSAAKSAASTASQAAGSSWGNDRKRWGDRQPHLEAADGVSHYKILTWLSADSSLNYAEPAYGCIRSVDDAPWYQSQATSDIYTHQNWPYLLDLCSKRYATSTRPVFIVQLDYFQGTLLDTPIDGPASVSGGQWSFYAIDRYVDIQPMHWEAYFIVKQVPDRTDCDDDDNDNDCDSNGNGWGH